MANILNKAQEFISGEQKGTQTPSSTEGHPKKQENSAYEGFGSNDSTSTGGFGRNSAGSAFSRANQMGAADPASLDESYDNDHSATGIKTGASTPGYRRDGDDGQDVNTNQQFRGQNLSFTSAANNDEPEI